MGINHYTIIPRNPEVGMFKIRCVGGPTINTRFYSIFPFWTLCCVPFALRWKCSHLYKLATAPLMTFAQDNGQRRRLPLSEYLFWEEETFPRSNPQDFFACLIGQNALHTQAHTNHC